LRLFQSCAQLGWSDTKGSRLESGTRHASELDAKLILAVCNVPHDEREAILELVRGGQDGCWVRPHHGLLPEAVPSVVFQQDTANSLVFYEPKAIPPILHTTEYAELDILPRLAETEDPAPHLKARLDRNSLLFADDSPDAVFYLHERALRSLPVDIEPRAGQLLYLAMLIGRQKPRIRIIPARQDRPRFAEAGFQLLRFKESAPVVCVAHETVTLILEGDHVPAYEAIVQELDKIALSEPDSGDLIVSMAE
jgi:hypothetical protein